jgi:hypothetical protein
MERAFIRTSERAQINEHQENRGHSDVNLNYHSAVSLRHALSEQRQILDSESPLILSRVG